MALFNNKEKQSNSSRKGVLGAFSVDVIKWEPETDQEASVISHKFEAEDFPTGSQLIVHPSQMAVFINNLASGNSLDNIPDEGTSQVAVFVGPCKIRLETGDSRFAPFRSISHALTGGESAYHSSVYFINTTYMNELSWGTHSPVVVTDPEEGINVHVRAFGLFGAHIEQTDTSIAVIQAGKFLRKVVGTRSDYTRDELIAFMRAKILEYVPDLLAKNIVDNKISVLRISTHLTEFSAELKEKLVPYFDEFGLTLDNFSFHNINVPEEDLEAINEMKIQKKRTQLEGILISRSRLIMFYNLLLRMKVRLQDSWEQGWALAWVWDLVALLLPEWARWPVKYYHRRQREHRNQPQRRRKGQLSARTVTHN